MRFIEQPIFKNPDLTDDTLVGAWLCPGVSRSGKDYSTAGNDMAAVGGVRLDEVGATFDGSSGYFTKALANFRSGDSQGTIVVFGKRSSIGGFDVLFSSCDNASWNHFLQFRVTDGNLLEIVTNEDGSNNAVRGDTTINADEWYMFTGVSSGTAWSLYVNNQDAETLSVPAGSNVGDWFADITLRDNINIGILNRNATPQLHFGGSIACCEIYSEPKDTGWLSYRWHAAIPEG